MNHSFDGEDPTEYWHIARQFRDNEINIQDEKLNEQFCQIKNQYIPKVSDSSCKIEDITGILFGGISSRFWLYRKYIISQDLQNSMDI